VCVPFEDSLFRFSLILGKRIVATGMFRFVELNGGKFLSMPRSLQTNILFNWPRSLQVTLFAHFQFAAAFRPAIAVFAIATLCFRFSRGRQNCQLPLLRQNQYRETERNLISCDTQRIFLSANAQSREGVYFLAA
jgi:hypothetical protein